MTNQRIINVNMPRSRLSAHCQEANPNESQDVTVAMNQATLRKVSMEPFTRTTST